VIVSDGSTDGTDEIVRRYEARCDFITLHRRVPDDTRNFASKVYAIRAGLERISTCEYDFIGNLDADVSFEPDYYERVHAKFQEETKLGIGGGVILDACGQKWVRQYSSVAWSVGGSIQMFRRQCYEDIGGYVPQRKGGEDSIAEVMARMHGWGVRSFPDIAVRHHRRTGTGSKHILLARFRIGQMEYVLGYHPLFEFARCLVRNAERPFILGSFFRMSGFGWAWFRREPRGISGDIVRYLRREQMQRLFAVFSRSRA
jgi:glycosyltransferase involved in cell wall biosynthesis